MSTDHAVVVRSVGGTRLIEYLDALKEIINPSDITDAGPRGPQYFAFFLADQHATTKLIDAGSIEINGRLLVIEPFIANIKTITLRNVPPQICDSEIMAHLNSLGKVINPLEKIPYHGMPPEWAHLCSFSRK